MAATARDFLLSRVTDLSLTPHHASLLPFSRQLLAGPLLPASSASKRRPPAVLCCLVSGVDGGGVSDDFVSTRKSGFDRGFSVIANMLKRIEPLDNSVISKGVSDSARDSMKQTISTMLGLLPSDQFSVTVRVSKRPLDRLLASSIITGYTLWNAEYRISLMRNFDISPDSSEGSNCSEQREVLELQSEGIVGGCGEVDVKGSVEDWEPSRAWSLGDLPPEALNYIQKLESELSTAKKELDAQKLENMQMEYDKGNNNNLLEYLRGLESDMVTELSKPSSLEVEEIIHQLVQNILQIFFKDDPSSAFMEDSALGITSNYQDGNFESRATICTSRDYLAKLLFWCMLLGHHFRGLENRLHLSCAVGLL